MNERLGDDVDSEVTITEVLDVVGSALGIEDRVGMFDAGTALFGALPETGLARRYGAGDCARESVRDHIG
jgi:hypothetical protein